MKYTEHYQNLSNKENIHTKIKPEHSDDNAGQAAVHVR